LQAVTDGEFSRDWWHLDYMLQLEGVSAKANPGPKFGGTEEQPPIPNVTGKLRYTKPIMIDDFRFLKSVTTKPPKFTIPSPSMLHLRAGRAGISREVYPDIGEFWADAAKAYRASNRQTSPGGAGLHLPAARRRVVLLSVRSEDPR